MALPFAAESKPMNIRVDARAIEDYYDNVIAGGLPGGSPIPCRGLR
jgi:hypothetical protein